MTSSWLHAALQLPASRQRCTSHCSASPGPAARTVVSVAGHTSGLLHWEGARQGWTETVAAGRLCIHEKSKPNVLLEAETLQLPAPAKG